MDDACTIIEDMGGVGMLIDDLDEFHELRACMIEEHSRLMEKYLVSGLRWERASRF